MNSASQTSSDHLPFSIARKYYYYFALRLCFFYVFILPSLSQNYYLHSFRNPNHKRLVCDCCIQETTMSKDPALKYAVELDKMK